MEKIKLNVKQKEAVEWGEGPLLIVAGAGTGKTRVLTERIVYLVESGKCKVREVLALAFNNDAAAELEGRLGEVLPLGSGFPEVMTFHAFCLEIIREWGLEIGVSCDKGVMEQSEAYLFMREYYGEFPVRHYLAPRPVDTVHKFLGHFGDLRGEGVSSEEYLKFVRERDWEDPLEKRKYEELAVCYAKYEELKQREGVLDFADLHYYALKILKERPYVLKKVQSRYKYVLVDEYQDTDPVQNELAELVAAEHGNLTVVGDDDQCIYRFRGASVENILEFKVRHKDAKEVALTENYRSPQEVLDLAYGVIQNNNPKRLEVELKIDKRLQAQRGDERAVECTKYGHSDEEYAEMVGRMRELAKGREWREMAVLTRNAKTAREVQNVLTDAGVPSEFLGARGLWNVPEVERVVKVLRAVADPLGLNTIFDYLSLREWEIPMDEYYRLLAEANKNNLGLYVLLRREGGNKNNPYAGQIKKAYETLVGLAEYSRERDALDTVYRVLEVMGWKDELLAGQVESVVGEKKVLNVAKFLGKVRGFCMQAESPTLLAYLDFFDSLREAGDNPQTAEFEYESNVVTITTVHKAKGREWPVVFLPRLVEGDFPSVRRGGEIEVPEELTSEITEDTVSTHEAEERRLFYVAVTRAREKLYLSWSEYYGELKTSKKPSRFLREAGLVGEGEVKKRGNDNPLLRERPVVEVELKEVEERARNMQKFSHSVFTAYKACPLKVYFSLVPVPTEISPYQQFGTQIHNVLNDFMGRVRSQRVQPGFFDEDVSREWLLDEWRRRFTVRGYYDAQVAERYREEGKRMLEWFYEDWRESGEPVPLELEKSFKFRLDDKLITGRFDRVDPGSGEGMCEVIDYKTGKSKTVEQVKKDGLQLSIYALAAREALGLEAEKMTFVYLKDEKKVSMEQGEKQLEKTKKVMRECVEGIVNCRFEPKPSPFVCKHCDYRGVCKYKILE